MGQKQTACIITVNAIVSSLLIVYFFVQIYVDSLYNAMVSGAIIGYFGGSLVDSCYAIKSKLRDKDLAKKMKMVVAGMVGLFCLGTWVLFLLWRLC